VFSLWPIRNEAWEKRGILTERRDGALSPHPPPRTSVQPTCGPAFFTAHKQRKSTPTPR
jgi:hypothetical protein